MDEEDDEEKTGCGRCLSELRLKNFCFHHKNASVFVDSQWSSGTISYSYLTYRLLISILFIAWSVADFFVEAGRWYSFNYALWLVFATNWSLLFLTISCFLMALSTLYYFCRQRKDATFQDLEPREASSIGCYLKFQWIVYNIAVNCAVVVSISYWAFIIFVDKSEFLRSHMSQLKHTLNTVFVVFDLFINATPIRIYHFIFSLTVGVVYAIFTAVYFMNDGIGPNGKPYAYYVLDWRNPLGSAVTCTLGFIVSILVQLILFAIYCFRIWMHRKIVSRMRSMEDTDRDAFARDLDAGDVDKEEESIFSNSQNRKDYRSVDDLELTSDR